MKRLRRCQEIICLNDHIFQAIQLYFFKELNSPAACGGMKGGISK